MEIKGIVHTGVVVKDIHAAIDFYHNVLGLDVYEDVGEWVTDYEEVHAMGMDHDCLHRIATLQTAEGSKVELVQFEDPRDLPGADAPDFNGRHHISFLVDDIQAWVEKLKEYDIEPFLAPLSYETEDAEGGVAYWMQFRDPFGVIVEMMQY